MKAVVQRVTHANVTVEGKEVAATKRGYCIFVGIMQDDTKEDALKLAQKIAKLRIFPDDEGKMRYGIKDIDGAILAISQFTLAANVRRGNRPSFEEAMPPQSAKELYEEFVLHLRKECIEVQTGIFGAMMQVSLTNDGPVTILLDSKVYTKESR